MLDSRTQLTIKHDDNSVFTDYSTEAHDFKRDTFTFTLDIDGIIYIGFYKKISAAYIHMTIPNTIAGELTAEYFDGTVWQPLVLNDDTKGLTRDGLINWETQDDQELVTIDSVEAQFIRIKTDQLTIDPVTFQAINIIFSEDQDICTEVPQLINDCFYPPGQTSFILNHVASRNYIMQRLRNVGYVKFDADNVEKNITEWDILDVLEIRQASMYYTITQIYLNLSDTDDDQYWQKYLEYRNKFEEAFALGRIRVDTNDDGEINIDEKRPKQTIRFFR